MKVLKIMKLPLVLGGIGILFFMMNYILLDEKQYSPSNEMTAVEKVELFKSRPLFSQMFLVLSILFGGSGLILAVSRLGSSIGERSR